MSQKIRIGNDINVTWSVLKKDKTPYLINSEILDVYMVVNHCKVDIQSVSVSGNRISFTYFGKDQSKTGSYALVLVENKGNENMITHDTKDAFVLVPHSWQEESDGEPVNVSVESVLNNDIIVPDEETITNIDRTGVISLKNREYNDETPDVMGYIILSKDSSFESQVNSINTIYEIRYDFDLGGETVAIPHGSSLCFSGGKLLNGIIELDNATIDVTHGQAFDGVTLSGTMDGEEIYSGWFSSIDDFIESVSRTYGYTLARFAKGTYYPTKSLSVDGRDDFEIDGGHAVLIYNSQKHAIRVNTSSSVTDGWESDSLSSQYVSGDESIESSIDLKKGDIVLLQDTASYSFSPYRDYKQGEFCEMDTATALKHPLYGNYVNSGTIVLYKPVLTRFKIKNIELQYNTSDTTAHDSLINGLYLKYCEDVLIENVKVLNFDIGINLASSYGAVIRNSSTISATVPVSDVYGIMISNSQNVIVSGCDCRGGNHGISVGGVYSGIGAIVNRNISVQNCVCTDFRSNYVGGIETHGNCEYFYILNNITTGVGLAGNHCKVVGNRLKSCSGTKAFGITLLEMTGYDHEIRSNNIDGQIYIDKYYASGAYQNFHESSNYSINSESEKLVIADNIWNYDSSEMNNTRNTGPLYIMSTSSLTSAIDALKNKKIDISNNVVSSTGAYINTVTTYADVEYRGNEFTNIRFSITNSGDFTFADNNVSNDSPSRLFDIGYASDVNRKFIVRNNKLRFGLPGTAIRWFNFTTSTTLTYYIVEHNDFVYDSRTDAVNVYFVERNSNTSKAWDICDNKFQYDSTASVCRISISSDYVLYDGNRVVDSNGAVVSSKITLQISATTFVNHSISSGTTSNRPTTSVVGQEYYDTTLSKPIWYNGSSVWVDATGTTV